METMRMTVYSSSLSGKAGLLDETKQVLQQVAVGYALDDVRAMVIDNNLLSKQSRYTRRAVWDAIRLRLGGIGDGERIKRLAQLVSSPILTVQAQNLILFYELCRSQPLLADLTTDCLFPMYAHGRSVVNKSEILNWLSQSSITHSEIASWSPQTREKIASNYLSIVRDFGLLTGVQQKRFIQVYLPLPTFLYVLYDLHERSISTKAIIESSVFHLLLVDSNDLKVLLADATRAGYITFRYSGTIYDLVFHYKSIDEVMRHVVDREVS